MFEHELDDKLQQSWSEASINEPKSIIENGSDSVCLEMFEQEIDDELQQSWSKASFNEPKINIDNGSESECTCLEMFEQDLDDELNNLRVKQVLMNPKATLRMDVSLSVLRCSNMTYVKLQQSWSEASFNEPKSNIENGSESQCTFLEMFEQELDDEPNNPKVTLRMEVRVSVLRCLNRN
jgi:hypothetical protein